MTNQRRPKTRPKRRRPQLTTGQMIALLSTIAAVLQALGYVIHGR